MERTEVRESVWGCDGNKRIRVEGPFGFNFTFIKKCWNVIKEDIMNYLKEFRYNEVFTGIVTVSFLVLIPNEFRELTL